MSNGLPIKQYPARTWREIERYPEYEMNEQKEVREKVSGRILDRTFNNKGYHYHLLRNNKVYAVNAEMLVVSTYPELMPRTY